MVPWGTALVTIVLPDSQLFTAQDCERPLSYDRRNQVYIVVNEAPVKQVLVPNSLCVNSIGMTIFR